MNLYDPNSAAFTAPLKTDTQPEDDVALETSQLMIRSPNDHDHHHEQPYKKFRPDPWSVDYLMTDPSSVLATMPLEVQ